MLVVVVVVTAVAVDMVVAVVETIQGKIQVILLKVAVAVEQL
jgi:hypothetical protein